VSSAEKSGKVRASFDQAAANYDSSRRLLVPCFEEFYRTAVAMAPFEPEQAIRVLDLGSGTGLLASFVLQHYPQARLTLVDISTEMLQKARQRFQRAGERVAILELDYNTQDLPGQYDLIVSALSIHHLEAEEKRRLFQKLFHSLQPGGAFINADHIEAPTPTLFQTYKELWIARTRELGVDEADLQAALERTKLDRLSTLEDQLRWLQQCGFRDVDCYYKWLHFAVFGGRRPES
jgi:tRNA (cmo5U34)-methyltransferase